MECLVLNLVHEDGMFLTRQIEAARIAATCFMKKRGTIMDQNISRQTN
jgi:ribosomal protein L16/L10AE